MTQYAEQIKQLTQSLDTVGLIWLRRVTPDAYTRRCVNTELKRRGLGAKFAPPAQRSNPWFD